MIDDNDDNDDFTDVDLLIFEMMMSIDSSYTKVAISFWVLMSRALGFLGVTATRVT